MSMIRSSVCVNYYVIKKGRRKVLRPKLREIPASTDQVEEPESGTNSETVLSGRRGRGQKLGHLGGRENLLEEGGVSQVLASKSRMGRQGLESVSDLATWG